LSLFRRENPVSCRKASEIGVVGVSAPAGELPAAAPWSIVSEPGRRPRLNSDESMAEFALDRFLPYLLNVLASRMGNGLARVYASRFDISIAEWRVIAHLSLNRNVSVRDIHEAVDMDKAKVSRAATRLEMLGYVEKRENPSDRRLVEMALTRKGRALLQEIAPLALAYQDEALTALDADEQATLRRLVLKLLAGRP
jgi:DNA-binding MarR family transcriptional regulator